MWKIEAEFSERNYTASQILDASYNDGTWWFDIGLEIYLGLGWAEWALLPATRDDVGITLNFTATHFNTNRGGDNYAFAIDLDNPTVDTYAFPALEIEGMEFQEHDSFVKPDLTSAIDYTGTVIMFVSGQLAEPIGAVVGLGIKGLAAGINIAQGQQVSRFSQIVSEPHHYQVLRNSDLRLSSPVQGQSETTSDVLFFKLNPVAGKHCGLTKVTLQGTLRVREYWIQFPLPPVLVWDTPIADISITICIPWFLRG
jgi:hypothetical protein